MVVERRYWDSDCSLGWLRSEPDKVKECQEVLQVAEDGQVMIVTSALTIAEVLNLEGRGSTFTIPPENAAAVIAFFRNPYIVVRNITRKVSEQAREFVWTHRVMPKDALHVATAIDAKLHLLNTFDGGLIAHSGRIGMPAIAIQRPTYAQPRLELGDEPRPAPMPPVAHTFKKPRK